MTAAPIEVVLIDVVEDYVQIGGDLSVVIPAATQEGDLLVVGFSGRPVTFSDPRFSEIDTTVFPGTTGSFGSVAMGAVAVASADDATTTVTANAPTTGWTQMACFVLRSEDPLAVSSAISFGSGWGLDESFPAFNGGPRTGTGLALYFTNKAGFGGSGHRHDWSKAAPWVLLDEASTSAYVTVSLAISEEVPVGVVPTANNHVDVEWAVMMFGLEEKVFTSITPPPQPRLDLQPHHGQRAVKFTADDAPEPAEAEATLPPALVVEGVPDAVHHGAFKIPENRRVSAMVNVAGEAGVWIWPKAHFLIWEEDEFTPTTVVPLGPPIGTLASSSTPEVNAPQECAYLAISGFEARPETHLGAQTFFEVLTTLVETSTGGWAKDPLGGWMAYLIVDPASKHEVTSNPPLAGTDYGYKNSGHTQGEIPTEGPWQIHVSAEVDDSGSSTSGDPLEIVGYGFYAAQGTLWGIPDEVGEQGRVGVYDPSKCSYYWGVKIAETDPVGPLPWLPPEDVHTPRWTERYLEEEAVAGASHWLLKMHPYATDPRVDDTPGWETVTYADCAYVTDNGLPLDEQPYLDGDQPGGLWEGEPGHASSIWSLQPESPLSEITLLDDDLIVP